MAENVIAYYDVHDMKTGEVHKNISTKECKDCFGFETRTIMTYARRGVLFKKRYKVVRLTPSRKMPKKSNKEEVKTKEYYNVTDLESGVVITQCTTKEVIAITGIKEVNTYAQRGIVFKEKWKIDVFRGDVEKEEEFTYHDIDLLDEFDRVVRMIN